MFGGKMEKSDMEVTDCKWCGAETVNTGTKECDRCWELRHRIENDLELAKKMIEHFNQSMNQGD